MASAVYLLCAATSIACAWLLFRGYRRSAVRLLLWSALCFVCLALNNILLFVDKVILPDSDSIAGLTYASWRSLAALAGIVLLLVGLIWESE